MKLGDILIQLGQITPTQLDEGLRAQTQVGGRLGTHLVELGFIGTDQVSQALARLMGVPAALGQHFSHADPAIVAKLPVNLATRYLAVPLGIARNGSNQIVVAMATPLDETMVDELSFALGARVFPLVAAEIAIANNIKRLYGAEVSLKTRQPQTMPAQTPTPRMARETPARSTPTASPAASPKTPVVATRAPTPSPAAPAPAPSKRPLERIAPNTPPPGPSMVLSLQTMSQAKQRPTVHLEEALHRLSQASSREQLATVLLDFMKAHFGCGMIFLVQAGQARVWRGFAPDVPEAAVETIAFPLSMASCFRLAHDREAAFRGPPPTEGKRLQRQIWKYLQCPEPTDVVVVPILVKSRVLNLVYAHADGRLADGPITDLQALCAATSPVYVRLIQKLKESAVGHIALAR